MSTSMRVKGSTLRALALVSSSEGDGPPATWKLMENGRRRRAAATVPDGTLDVGTLLRTTRRRRRISVDRAVSETRIPRRYIEALERNAPASAFPGLLYARGFLRTYARYLRIADEDALLAVFGDAPPPIEILEEVVPPPETRRRHIRILVVAVAFVAASVIVATSGSSHPVAVGSPPTFPAVAPPSTDTKAPAAARQVERPVVATVPELTIEVGGGRTWLQVVADGATVERGHIVAPGFRQRFAARRSLTMVVGNAGAVRILFAGAWRDGVGAPGQVVTITVTMRDGVPELRITPRE